MANPEKQAELFWAKVDKSAGQDGCWLYTGFRKWDGYGWLARHINGKVRYMTAHRYSWTLTNGAVGDGLQVLHRCDNPPCCNPKHLFIGTHADNHADKVAKRRHTFGERTSRNKLTLEKVQEIRSLLGTMTQTAIAKRYGVNQTCITAIKIGKTWKIGQVARPLHPGRVRPRRAA